MPNTNSILSKYALSLLLTSCLLFALPASNAHAHYRVTGRDLSKIAKFELKSKMCRAKATTDHATPLMEAARKGDAEKVKALIAAGANVNAKNNEGKTIVDYADIFDNPRGEEIRAILGGEIIWVIENNNAPAMEIEGENRILNSGNTDVPLPTPDKIFL